MTRQTTTQRAAKTAPTLLSHAINQITTPSFWHALPASQYQTSATHGTPHDIRRAAIVESVARSKKPVLFTDLCTTHGCSKQSMTGLVKPLIESGVLIRTKNKDQVYLSIGNRTGK